MGSAGAGGRAAWRAGGLSLLAVLASALLLASAAEAAKAPSFDFGEEGAQGGQLSGARGIAVNEAGAGGVAAGTIYVAEFGNNRIQSFAHEDNGTPADPSDDDYEFIRAWGWNVIASGQPADTGAGFEICEAAAECKAATAGSGPGQFASAGLAGGLAVNQSTGDVYAVDRGNNRVQQFSATGSFIRSWGSAGEEAGQFGFGSTLAIAGLAADASGELYVADAGNARVQKFDSEGNFLRAAGWDVVQSGPGDTAGDEYEVCVPAEGDECKAGAEGNSGAGQYGNDILPSFLAASACGNDVYAVGRIDGTVYRLNGDLEFIEEFPETAGSTNNRNAMAVGCPDGHLFFTEERSENVFELDPETGEVLAQHPAYTLSAEGDEWVSLAIDSAAGRMLGARTTSAPTVRVWGEAGILPGARALAPAANTGTRATLAGTVDPNEVPLEECFFEWGETAAYGNLAPCAPGPGGIGEGDEPVEVQAEIAGLTPHGAVYHYRLVAVNENFEAGARSEDESFATPDTAITAPASEIGPREATLNGTVDPDAEAIAECGFEWGETTAYGNTAPCVPGPGGIGAGEGPVAVAAEIAGLVPGVVYHFRLAAEYASGAAARGEDESFRALGPEILDTWAAEVGVSEATLSARIDPNGEPTTFRFEYGSQGPCSANPDSCQSVPLPEGSVGGDSEPHEVSASLEGLSPGTAYRYRVIATNPDAKNEGPELSFTTYEPLTHAPCPNDDLRAGPSASLPDCRAYELVSPPEKGGGDIVARGSIEQAREAAYRKAALGGERVTYTSTSAFAGAVASEAANQYFSTRGAGGWSTESIQPPRARTVPGQITSLGNTFFRAFTADVCTALAIDLNEEPLGPAGIAGFVNLNLHENCGTSAGSLEALTVGVSPEHSGTNLGAQGRNLTADGVHVVFSASADLPGSAPAPAPNGNRQVYDAVRNPAGRELRTVSILPGGEADPGGSLVGSIGGPARESNLERALADDGSRVFWTSGAGRLYVRANPAGPLGAEAGECADAAPGEACTTALSAAEATFWTATPDGSKAIYTEGDTLDEIDVEAAIAGEAGASEEIASGVGGLLGASEDLERLYFTSTEDLAEGATEGELNVYLREAGGGLRFVASAEEASGIDSAGPISRPSRVSADGLRLAFQSGNPDLAAATAGYDSTDPDTGEATLEVYRYDAAANGGAGELVCVSCNPSGARGGAGEAPFNYRVDVSISGVAAWLPTCEWSNHCKRTLADGADRVLFNAIDSLVPEDRNGVQDVYQWEAPGTGTCTASDPRYFPANRGCIHLISSGGGSIDSELLDASASGADAFFTTGSDIDPRDPGSIDLYDARIGGGFPPPAREADPCVGDACQSVPPSPEAPAIGSEAYAGPPAAAPAGRCAAPARRARSLSRRAKRLRKGAGRAEAPRRAKRMRRKARRLARKAKRQSNRAKRCRRRARASRRAGL